MTCGGRSALRADMIAVSFVQGPDDAEPPRKIMDEMGVRLPLIAKIEKPQAVAALDEVIAAFDGIRGRGDLGVEYPLEQVPLVQEARDQTRPAGRQTRHRGHPDARVDDQCAAADAGRGLRCRQRRARRRGRAHALRGDQRRRLPGGRRGDHGADHRGGGAGLAVLPARERAGDHRRPPSPGRRPRSGRRSGPGRWWPSP